MIIDAKKNILIVGLGLLGGSYAQVLKRYGFHISAITRSQSSIDYALKNNMIDEGTDYVCEELVKNADIVVFALYPHIFVEWIKENQHLFKPGCILTDVTGVKSSIVYDIQDMLRDDVEFIADPIPVIKEDVFNSVFKATKLHQIMKFDYRSISATNYTPHELYPYKIYSQKGDWYVLGFSPKHSNFSTYTLARMKNIDLREKFEPDPEYSKKVHIDPNFGIWNNNNPPEKIELLFDKSVNTYILERTWHKNQKCHQNEDGSVYLSFTSNQDQETLFWVMKFGSKVKVLNPPSLREKVIEELKKSLNNY